MASTVASVSSDFGPGSDKHFSVILENHMYIDKFYAPCYEDYYCITR